MDGGRKLSWAIFLFLARKSITADGDFDTPRYTIFGIFGEEQK